MKKALFIVCGILLGYAGYMALEARFWPPDANLSQNTATGTTTVSLLFVGDIMPSRWVDKQMQREGYDFPFAETTQMTQHVDLAFANLESPITDGRTIRAGEMVFRTDPEFVPSLARAGFDVVSLANNHTPNFGQKGLQDTFTHLQSNGIRTIGAGTTTNAYAPLYENVSGLRVAFVAQNDTLPIPASYCAGDTRLGTACFNIERLKQAISEAKTNADFVVFSMHGGIEYASSSNASQETYARTAIDAGADIVIGHHPHTIQNRELYNGKWIYYSLGNYIFDQNWSRNTRLGLALIVDVGKDSHRIERMKHQIVRVDHFAQPRFSTEEESADMFAYLELP